MNWRWHLFWFKDRITGGNIKKKYTELNEDYQKLNIKRQKDKLNYLLKYAKDNCKFYSKYKLDIKNFPVINKQIIKDNFDDIFVKKYDINKLHKMSTSGSTGTPFTIYQNAEKRNAVVAEVLFYGVITGYYFGEKQMFLRAWTKVNRKSGIKKFLQNMIPYDITCLDDDVMKECLHIINNEEKLSCILSYASTLDRLSDYIIKNNKSYNSRSLKTILSSSELLNEKTRKHLSNVFNCKCYSRYSNQENGILGQDNGVEKKFKLNETNYYFEFLKLDSDKPANEGEISRIIVTDLYNYAMPMIRYDTGDLGIYKKERGNLCITEIYGRRQDMIFDTLGNPVSPDGISVNMWGEKGVNQWQFIQYGKSKYEIKLNVDNKFNKEKIIIDAMKNILGIDAKIKITYVDEIPVLSSGKRKYIENTYKGGK